MPDDAIVVVDTGHAGMWMGGMYDLTHARRRATCAAPAISAGRSRPASAPNAPCPDRPVVTFTGDAGFWYHIGEIETAVRWKHQRGHGGQQQFERRPVETRLRPEPTGGEQTAKGRAALTYTSVDFAARRHRHRRAGDSRERPGDFSKAYASKH